jgi:hypothetical protein
VDELATDKPNQAKLRGLSGLIREARRYVRVDFDIEEAQVLPSPRERALATLGTWIDQQSGSISCTAYERDRRAGVHNGVKRETLSAMFGSWGAAVAAARPHREPARRPPFRREPDPDTIRARAAQVVAAIGERSSRLEFLPSARSIGSFRAGGTKPSRPRAMLDKTGSVNQYVKSAAWVVLPNGYEARHGKDGRHRH